MINWNKLIEQEGRKWQRIDCGLREGGDPTMMSLVLPPGPLASISASAAITTTETVAVRAAIPANVLQVGTEIEVVAFGTISATTAGTILGRLRAGVNGTIADTQVAATAALGSQTTAVGWHAEGQFQVNTIGSAGTCIGNLEINVGTVTGRSAQSATVAINTTVANFLDLTFIGGGTAPSITVVSASIDVLKP